MILLEIMRGDSMRKSRKGRNSNNDLYPTGLFNLRISSFFMKQLYFSILVLLALAVDLTVDYFIYVLIIVFFESVIISFKDKRFNVFQIFLIMIFIFVLNRIFLSLLGIGDFRDFSFYSISKHFDDLHSIKTLKTLIVFLLGTSLGFAYTLNTKKRFSQINFLNKNKAKLIKLYKFALYVLLIPNVLRSFFLVRSALIHGYVESVHLGNANIPFSWLLNYANILFYAFALINLYYAENKKEFRNVAFVFILPLLIYQFTGQRGETIYTLLILIWIWSNYYNKIKYSTLFFSGIIIIVLSSVLGIYRFNMSFSGISSVSFIDLILNFFEGRGVSLGVLQLSILFEDSFDNRVPFLFGYIIDNFNSGAAYTIEAITNKNYLGYHLAHLSFPSAYFRGLTLGTSIIAEIYLLVNGNFLFVFLVSFFITIFVMRFEKNLFRNPIYFAMGFQIISRFVYSPRDSLGKIISRPTLYIMIIVLFVYIIEKLLKNHKKGSISNYKNMKMEELK